MSWIDRPRGEIERCRADLDALAARLAPTIERRIDELRNEYELLALVEWRPTTDPALRPLTGRLRRSLIARMAALRLEQIST